MVLLTLVACQADIGGGPMDTGAPPDARAALDAGTPDLGAALPDAGEVHPDAAEVHPDAAEVHPDAAAGFPDAAEVHPDAMAGDAIDFTPGTLPAEAPAWVANLVPGTWAAISTNTISDVDPARDPSANPNYPNEAPWRGGTGQAGVITAWGGGAMAYGFGEKGTFLVWGGGHGDYHGNEIYAFDLSTLRWSRLNDPYPNPMFNGIDAYPEGHYPDGTPVPVHTTDRIGYHPGTNSFITLEVERNNLGGYVVPIPYLFSLDRREWRHGPESPHSLSYMGWSAYDSSRDLFWMEPGGAPGPISSFDPKAQNADGTFGTWVNYDPQLPALGAMGAYDPVDDALIVTTFRGSQDIRGVDPKAPRDTPVTLRTDGPAPGNYPEAHGWEWSTTRAALIFWAGAHVYQLKSSGDWKTDLWRWTDITNPANTVTPEYATNGVFSRFRVINYGGVEVAVTVNAVDGPVYAFRIP
ncbi:MAG: hypothetical protein U1E65_09930 [Myxococcota bacterium]